jgi:16S rRNA U516 pseudouridylate synthase RsuA-like enzyme
MPPGAPRRPGHAPLERALSKLGLASRTEARELIRACRVAVEGGIETVVTGGAAAGVSRRAGARKVILFRSPGVM